MLFRSYDLWYEQRYEVLRTYTDTMPEKEPLSRNKEFKSIRDAVIAEALRLPAPRVMPDEEPMEEFEIPVLDEEAPPEIHVEWTAAYKEARKLWHGKEPDYPAAYAYLLEEAEKGNVLAMHDVGKMRLEGIGCEKEPALAQEWFHRAFGGF